MIKLIFLSSDGSGGARGRLSIFVLHARTASPECWLCKEENDNVSEHFFFFFKCLVINTIFVIGWCEVQRVIVSEGGRIDF